MLRKKLKVSKSFVSKYPGECRGSFVAADALLGDIVASLNSLILRLLEDGR